MNGFLMDIMRNGGEISFLLGYVLVNSAQLLCLFMMLVLLSKLNFNMQITPLQTITNFI